MENIKKLSQLLHLMDLHSVEIKVSPPKPALEAKIPATPPKGLPDYSQRLTTTSMELGYQTLLKQFPDLSRENYLRFIGTIAGHKLYTGWLNSAGEKLKESVDMQKLKEFQDYLKSQI